MNESIFEKALKDREKDQELKKAANGLESKKINEQIHLSIPVDLKEEFLVYCKNHYTTPSAQLRAWIDEFCH